MSGFGRRLLIYLVGIIMLSSAVWLGIRLAFPQRPARVTIQPSSAGMLWRLLGRSSPPTEATSYQVDKETGAIKVTHTDSTGQEHKYRIWPTDKGWVVYGESE